MTKDTTDLIARTIIDDLADHVGGRAWDEAPENDRDNARSLARTVQSHLSASGLVIVPREASNAMAEVGTEARWRSAVRDPNNVRETYRAMINAALSPKE